MAAHLNDDPTLQLDPRSERWAILQQLGLALATCEPPCVFGLDGDWGSGKTSFLRRLYLEISGQKPPGVTKEAEARFREGWTSSSHLQNHWDRIEPIWFEAWNYQAEAVPVVALLHEIRRQVLDRLGALDQFKHKAERLRWMGLHAVGQALEKSAIKIGYESPKVGGVSLGGPKVEAAIGMPSLQATREAYNTEHFVADSTTDRLREHLNDTIELLLSHKNESDRRLVVFVDDLDRCDPEAAFRLIEGIRVYLNLPSCVFVLGLNQREVERAVSRILSPIKHEGMDEDAVLVRAQEYIEKLCSSTVHLPRFSTDDQEAMLRELLADTPCPEVVEWLYRLHSTHPFLPANPRRIKAWCGVVRRMLELRATRRDVLIAQGKVREGEVGNFQSFAQADLHEARALAVVASLYQFHSPLYAILEAQPGFIETLNDWAKGPSSRDLEGRLSPHFHAAIRRFRLPSREGASTFEDAMSIGVLHCARLLAAKEFETAPLREIDVSLYLAR